MQRRVLDPWLGKPRFDQSPAAAGQKAESSTKVGMGVPSTEEIADVNRFI
jgi:hypothetical protein